MRISRRPSGGRGEYELTGTLPSGLRARQLEKHHLTLEFPRGLLIHTRVRMVLQGGKQRLRRIPGQVDIQIQKQIAAAFMMPSPARENVALGAGEPIMQDGAYAIEHIDIDNVLAVPPNAAVLQVGTITILNRSHQGEEIDLNERVQFLEKVWRSRIEFPDDIAGLLEEHERMVRSQYVDSQTQSLVARLQQAVSERCDDLGIVYSRRGDVLPKLADALNYQLPKPIIIDALDPLDIPLKRRTVKEWKRWANARGPASARFKQSIRTAYRGTCLFCGAHYPATPYNSTPGVDAAYILPWSDNELDEVFNGLCLCKTHHWAFDEEVIRLRFNNGHYVAQIPEEVRNGIISFDIGFTLDKLQHDLGAIPPERLPVNQSQWPNPESLETLAALY